MRLPGSSPAFIGLPHHSNGSTYRFYPRTRFSTGRLSGLQLFLNVQASQLARLPDRSYRCKFPRKAAEASTSEQNVRRCLRTHRTCYPPDYRQLAERGLPPRKIRSFVGCSLLFQAFPNAMRRLFAENRVDERYRDFSATYSDESGIGIEYRDRVEGVGRWE